MNSDAKSISECYVSLVCEASLATETMSVDQLKDYLMTIKGSTPVGVEVESAVKMNKKNRITGRLNPYTTVIKHSTINGVAGGDYELGIQNRELDAHSDNPDYMPSFKGESLWGGKGIRVSPILIQHRDDPSTYYLAITVPRSGTATYTHNGDTISIDDLKPYIAEPKEPAKQIAVGITNTSQPRYPALRNIKKITINNVTINVV
jgi:hypothetical protein